MRVEGEELDPTTYLRQVMGIVDQQDEVVTDRRRKPRGVNTEMSTQTTTDHLESSSKPTSCCTKVVFMLVLTCFLTTSLLIASDYPRGRHARRLQQFVREPDLDSMQTGITGVLVNLTKSSGSGVMEVLLFGTEVYAQCSVYGLQVYHKGCELYENHIPTRAEAYSTALQVYEVLMEKSAQVQPLLHQAYLALRPRVDQLISDLQDNLSFLRPYKQVRKESKSSKQTPKDASHKQKKPQGPKKDDKTQMNEDKEHSTRRHEEKNTKKPVQAKSKVGRN